MMWLFIDEVVREVFDDTKGHRRCISLHTLHDGYNAEEDVWVFDSFYELLNYFDSTNITSQGRGEQGDI